MLDEVCMTLLPHCCVTVTIITFLCGFYNFGLFCFIADRDTIKRVIESGEDPACKPMHVPTPPPYRPPSSRMSNRFNRPPSTPISDYNSAPINISHKGSYRNSPARTPTPVRKPWSRLACTPVTEFNHVGSRPLQVKFPMQVPIPESPVSVPYSPPAFLS